MKPAKLLHYLIYEMGRSSKEFENQFTSFSDQIEKTIFLLAYCTDREPENHWTKELNGVLKKLYTKNNKGNNNRKNFSYDEVYAKMVFIFEPMPSFLIDLRKFYEFDGYPISNKLESKKILSLCSLLAKHVTDTSPVFIKLEDVQKALDK